MRITKPLSTLLIAIAIVPLAWAAAAPLRSSCQCRMTIDSEIIVATISPRFVLEVRYPDGGSTLYEGNRIPSTLTVDLGTRVELRFMARVKEPGTYSVSAESYSLIDTSGMDASTGASCEANNRTGNVDARAFSIARDYVRGLGFRLEVSYRASLRDGSSRNMHKAVTVWVRAPTSSTQSGTLATLTVVSPGSSTQSAGTSTSSYTPGTVKWITSTTESRELSVTPSKLDVDAGDVAGFKLCSSLESPKFRVENLPAGYRYLITEEGDCYALKIFTHPLSYGRFSIGVVAYQGNVEERSSISLVVERAEPSSSPREGANGSVTTRNSVSPTQEAQQTHTSSSTEFSPSVLTANVTSVGYTQHEKGYPLNEVLGMLAAILGLILILLLFRRRT